VEEFELFASKLEELGEAEVRERFAHGAWSNRNKSYAEEWLRRKDEEHPKARAALRDAREEEALSISRESKEIAERALAISEKQASEAARAAEAAERQALAAEETSTSAKRQARYAMYAAIAAIIMALIAIRKDIESFILWLLQSIVA